MRRKDSTGRVLKDGESERKNGGYQYRWSDKRGRHYLYAQTLYELRKKEDEIQKTVMVHDLDYSTATLNDIFEVWYQTKRGIRDNTLQSYKRKFMRYAHDEIGFLPISSIKKTAVKQFYSYLERERQLSFGTIRIVHIVLYQLFELAVDEDLINKNPCQGALKELKTEFKDRNALTLREQIPLTPEEENAFLRFVKHDGYYRVYYPLFHTMLKTGMRVGEALGLCWENVDLKNNFIEIDHSLKVYSKDDKTVYAIGPPKTKKSIRKIPLLDETVDVLSELKKERLKKHICYMGELDGYNDFIFFKNSTHLLSVSVINRVIKQILFKYGNQKSLRDPIIPSFTSHTLRYTYATRLCESGVNIKVIQEILGHEKIDTTMEIYVKTTNQFQQEELKYLKEFYTKMQA